MNAAASFCGFLHYSNYLPTFVGIECASFRDMDYNTKRQMTKNSNCNMLRHIHTYIHTVVKKSLICILWLSVSAAAIAQTMTDEQIVSFIRSESDAGKFLASLEDEFFWFQLIHVYML